MADIELMIKIPEETYKATCNGSMLPPDVKNAVNGIKNGTPLPKGHGDLIDRDKVSSKLVSLIRKFYKMFPTERLHSNVDRAKINEVQHLIRTLSEEKPIIEADTEESEG